MEKRKSVKEKKMEGSESYYSKKGMNAPGWCQSDKPAELHWDDAPAGGHNLVVGNGRQIPGISRGD